MNTFPDRFFPGNVTVGEKIVESPGIDSFLPGNRKGSYVGREKKSLSVTFHVQRLYPESVPTEKEPAAAGIPNRKRESAVQVFGGRFSLLLVKVKNDLGVRSGSKPVTAAFKVPSQFGKVVDLSVVDDDHVAGLVEDRLFSRGKVDYAQPAVSQSRSAIEEETFLVRTSSSQKSRRPGHPLPFDGALTQ